MTRTVRNYLGLIVAACIALRVGAWLVSPVLPIIAVLFVLTGVFEFVARGRPPS